MALAFRFAARSDVGRIRSKNDDSAYAGRHLAVVADGMGGHVGGDVASASAVIDLTHLDRSGFGGHAVTELADEIQNANQNLAELVRQQPRLAGMGTTVTSLLIDGDQIALCHIGDSRAYRLRGESFEQITTDHTFVQRLIEEGRLRPEEAETHPHRNVLMRVLGDVDASPELEAQVYDSVIGERWLLCSDGLNAVLKPAAIESLLRSDAELDDIAQTLVRATLKRGAPDNVTVVVLEVVDAADLEADETDLTGALPDPEEALTSDQLTARARSSVPATEPQTAPAPWAAPAQAQTPQDTSAAELRRGLDELPHILVGAAANATQTGRIPTVSGSAAARRATLVRTSASDSLTDISEVDSALQRRGSHRRGRILGTVVALVVIAALVTAGALAYAWTRGQYFVGSDGENVAIYQGVDQSLGPLQLSELQQSTDLAVDDLPGYARSRVEDTIAADDLGHAESILLGLRSDAARSDRERQDAEEDSPSPSPSSGASEPEASPGATSPEASPGATGTVNYPESSSSAGEGRRG